MRVVVVTPPAEPAITLAEAKDHLKVRHDTEDALIEGYVAAAIEHMEGPNSWLGRSLRPLTLEVRLDSFTELDCGGTIALPFPPIVEVTSVKNLDPDGVEQTVDPARYQLLGNDLALTYRAIWPNIRCEREAVRVRYTAGYSELPQPIRAAILLMVGDLFAFRETTVPGAPAVIPMSTTVINLLAPFRIWR